MPFTAFVFLLAWTAACGGSDSPTEPSPVAGSYAATVFEVTPAGEALIDVLAEGGTISLSIATNNATTGSLFLPASIAGSDVTLSLNGTAVVSGSTMHFEQATDTFVRDLTFTVNGSSLEATNQSAGGATFTVVLTRQ